MKLARRKKRALYVPVTSFGDIAFLLIIFFMLASAFMRESHIELKEAAAPDIEKMQDVKISVVMDKEGALWLQGQPCPISALAYRVDDLLGDDEDRSVMLKIDKDQRQQDFGEVLMALSEAGADIILLGREEQATGEP